MRLTLSVTAAALASGRVLDAFDGPHARALAEALPPPLVGWVLDDFLVIDYGPPTGIREVPTPPRLRAHVERHDCGDAVKASTFTIEIPDP